MATEPEADDLPDFAEEAELPPSSGSFRRRASRKKPILDGYRYYAFISYRRVDSASVKWLHRALESYRVPDQLEGSRHLPERLYPVFRDQDELAAAADLTEELISALKQSKYLIVACSPDTPASKWVNQEVQTFIDLGRRRRILPIIVRGDNPDLVLPPALLAGDDDLGGKKSRAPLVPLAADVGKDGRRLAFLKIVAAILECRLEELRRRDQMQLRRQRMALGAISCATILLIGILSIAFLYQRGRAVTFSATVGTAQRGEAEQRKAREDADLLAQKAVERTKDALLGEAQAVKGKAAADKRKQEAEQEAKQAEALAKTMEESALIAQRKAYDARLAEVSKIALQKLDGESVAAMLTKESEFPTELRTFAWGLLYNLRNSIGNPRPTGHQAFPFESKAVEAIALDQGGKRIALLDNEGRIGLIDVETAANREVVLPKSAWAGFQEVIRRVDEKPENSIYDRGSFRDESRFWVQPVRLQFAAKGTEVRALTTKAIFTWRYEQGEATLTEYKGSDFEAKEPIMGSLGECNERGTIVGFRSRNDAVKLVPISPNATNTMRLLPGKPEKASPRIRENPAARILSFQGQAGRLINEGRHLLVASAPGRVSLWSTQLNLELAQVSISEFPRSLLSVEFSNDGQRLAALDSDFTLRTWQVKCTVDLSKVSPRKRFSPDAFVVIGPERVIRGAGPSYGGNSLGSSVKSALLMSHSGHVIGCAVGGLLKVWDIGTGKNIAEITGGVMLQSELSADGSTAAYWQQGKVYRVAVGSRAAKSQRGCVDLEHLTATPSAISFSDDGSQVATADGIGKVRCWKRSPSGEFVQIDVPQVEPSHKRSKQKPEKEILFEGANKSPITFDHGQPKRDAHADQLTIYHAFRVPLKIPPPAPPVPPTRPVTPMQAFANSRVPQPQGGHRTLRFRTPARPTSLALSADERILAAGTEGGHVLLWRVYEESQPPVELERHAAAVTAMCWSPDGKTLATGTKDGKLCCWDPLFAPLQPQLTIDAHGDEITCLWFSPDGKTLASGSRDRKVTLWEAKFPAAGAVTVTP